MSYLGTLYAGQTRESDWKAGISMEVRHSRPDARPRDDRPSRSHVHYFCCIVAIGTVDRNHRKWGNAA
jgi:hypothetical protein